MKEVPNEKWVQSSTDPTFALCLDENDGRYAYVCTRNRFDWESYHKLNYEELMHLSEMRSMLAFKITLQLAALGRKIGTGNK